MTLCFIRWLVGREEILGFCFIGWLVEAEEILGFLSNESSSQLRGQCDNICLHSIFQQEGPQNVFFAGRRYPRDYLADSTLQCEKVLRTR